MFIGKCPYAILSWRNNWDDLTVFFQFPLEIRKIIYTTNKLTAESCFHLHKILDSVVLIHPLNIINTNSPCYPKVSSSFSLFVFLIPA